jgi:hypothetical protein
MGRVMGAAKFLKAMIATRNPRQFQALCNENKIKEYPKTINISTDKTDKTIFRRFCQFCQCIGFMFLEKFFI